MPGLARRTLGQRDLRLLGQRAEAHVRDEERDVEAQRPRGAGADDDVRAHGLVVQARHLVELGRDELQVVPRGEPVARHAHGVHRAVVPHLLEAVDGEVLDERDVRLLHRAVGRVGVVAVVRVPPEGLGVVVVPGRHLGLVHEDLVVLHPGREALQPLLVLVLAHAGVDAEVPVVDAADEAVALDGAVGEEGAPVQAAAVEHRDVVVPAHDDEVDVGHPGGGGHAVLQFAPARHGHGGLDGARHLRFLLRRRRGSGPRRRIVANVGSARRRGRDAGVGGSQGWPGALAQPRCACPRETDEVLLEALPPPVRGPAGPLMSAAARGVAKIVGAARRPGRPPTIRPA